MTFDISISNEKQPIDTAHTKKFHFHANNMFFLHSPKQINQYNHNITHPTRIHITFGIYISVKKACIRPNTRCSSNMRIEKKFCEKCKIWSTMISHKISIPKIKTHRHRNRQHKFAYPLMLSIFLMVLGFMSAGNSSVSSISTISTSPDWISAAPSHEIIIGIQSPPPEQFSGVCKKNKNKKTMENINNISATITEQKKNFFCVCEYNQLIDIFRHIFGGWTCFVESCSFHLTQKEKRKMSKNHNDNNSTSHSIVVGFVNFSICKFLVFIARIVWKFIFSLCDTYIHMKERTKNEQTNVRLSTLPLHPNVLKPFFLFTQRPRRLCHIRTEKGLKFIWSLQPHINKCIRVSSLQLRPHREIRNCFSSFWFYFSVFFPFSEAKKKKRFQLVQNETRWCIPRQASWP